MYKGNMEEFISQLNLFFVQNGVPCRLRLSRNQFKHLHLIKGLVGIPNTSSEGDWVLYFMDSKTGSGSGQDIHDTEDFEEVVYERVKKYLKRIGYVQG